MEEGDCFVDYLTDEGIEKEVLVHGASGYKIMFYLAMDFVVFINSVAELLFLDLESSLLNLLWLVKSAEK